VVCVAIISGKLNGFPGYDIFFYLRTLVIPAYLYYLFLYNTNDSVRDFNYRLIIFFFALQIPASWVKLLIFGGPEIEDHIGTVSMYQASMTTLIAGIGAAYSFSKYLFTRKNQFLFILCLFILFSQIGGKRIVLFLIPFVMFIQFIVYSRQKKINLTRYVRLLLFVVTFFLFFTYFIIRLNPSFNKEEEVWGSFDLEYAISFVFDYSVRDLNQFDMSRNEALLYFIQYMSDQSVSTVLFGHGAGLLLDYKFVESSGVTELFEVRYGGRMAFVWILLQTGLLGVVTFFIFLSGFLKRVNSYTVFGSDKLAFYGMFIVILIDIIFYSMSSLQYFSVMGPLLGYAAFLERRSEASLYENPKNLFMK
jgi:flagellar biogenesis protein FliO